MSRYRRRRWRSPLDPFVFLDNLINRGLSLLERTVDRGVERLMQKVERRRRNKR